MRISLETLAILANDNTGGIVHKAFLAYTFNYSVCNWCRFYTWIDGFISTIPILLLFVAAMLTMQAFKDRDAIKVHCLSLEEEVELIQRNPEYQ